MTEREFLKKLLEAQIRGMLVGVYKSSDSMTPGEREVFFEEIFRRGFFFRDNREARPYENIDAMLNDLVRGKSVLHMKLPDDRRGGPGLISFTDDTRSLFRDFNAMGRDPFEQDQDAVDFTRFDNHKRPFNVETHLAEDQPPQIPGGFWSSLWNRFVKLTTGHSSKTWREYDKYQADVVRREKIDAAQQNYANEHNGNMPGTNGDDYTTMVLEENRKGMVQRGEIEERPVRPRRPDPDSGFIKNPEVREILRRQNHEVQAAENQIEKEILKNKADEQRQKRFEQLRVWDGTVYETFFSERALPEEQRTYKSLDAALAQARQNYFEDNKEARNSVAKREEQRYLTEMMTAVYKKRGVSERHLDNMVRTTVDGLVDRWSHGAKKLYEDNLFLISEHLKEARHRQGFTDSVDAEMNRLKELAVTKGNIGLYDTDTELTRYECEVKLAMKELKLEGAERFKSALEAELEEKEDYIEIGPERPDDPTYRQDMEDRIKAGNIDLEVLQYQILREDNRRFDLTQKNGDISLNPSSDLYYDMQRLGLVGYQNYSTYKGNNPAEDPFFRDQSLLLKIMKVQDDAMEKGEPVPFVLGYADGGIDKITADKALDEAVELGFFTAEKIAEVKEKLNDDRAKEKGVYSAREVFSDDSDDESVDEYTAMIQRREQERQAEEEKKKAEALKQQQKEDFKDSLLNGKNTAPEALEYKRYMGLADSLLGKEMDSNMKTIAAQAKLALDRMADVMLKEATYDKETALHDMAVLIALDGCCRNTEFADRFNKVSDPVNSNNNYENGVIKSIKTVLKRNNMADPVIGQDGAIGVPSTMLRKNDLGKGKGLSLMGMYMETTKREKKEEEDFRERAREEALKDYSKAQLAIINDPGKLAAVQMGRDMVADNLEGPMSTGERKLQDDAKMAAQFLFNTMLKKSEKVSKADDLKNDMNTLIENLTTLAAYQSLKNPEYRAAYKKLVDAGRAVKETQASYYFNHEYYDLIKQQVTASQLVSSIMNNRAMLAELVFLPGPGLYTNIEDINLKNKVKMEQFSSAAQKELKNEKDGFIAENKGRNRNTLAQENYELQLQHYSTLENVMKSVCKDLSKGSARADKAFKARQKQEAIAAKALKK